MSRTNNLEPYHINYVDASWLSIERNAAGIFIDFNINAGDLVTRHEFNPGAGNDPDNLIFFIENLPNNSQEVGNYKNTLYEPTINASGLPLTIRMVITDVHGRTNTIDLDQKVPYTLGTYASNCENEYEINYVSAPYDPYEENGRSIYIIINMDIHDGDIVCGSNFEPDGDLHNQTDTFTVNVISNENKDRPLMRYAGIFGPFNTHNLGVSLSTSVNDKPVSSPLGIKSYGSETDKNIHQPA